MNKNMILVLAALVIIIGAGVGFLVINKDDSSKLTTNSSETADSSKDVKDESDNSSSDSETLNACDVTSKLEVESALGFSVNSPKDSGVTNIGTMGQTCYYSFDDTDSVINSFYVDISVYDSQAEADDARSYSGMDDAVDLPSEIGSFAKYKKSDNLITGDVEFVMYIQRGVRVTKLIIAQREGKVTFTDESAKAALDQILASAKLDF